MKNLKVSIKDKGVKLAVISFEDEIKLSLKELRKNGILGENQCIQELPEAKLKNIIKKYKMKNIPRINRDPGGGKHVSHQL
ncbi:hypothetical protein [Niallia sp. FSL R7-0271]|uniref:hypothetical protein n=1 Tax=Niallia sp. FSL R7-0271 TaxID=2921678 RepID=UPI0030F9BEFA